MPAAFLFCLLFSLKIYQLVQHQIALKGRRYPAYVLFCCQFSWEENLIKAIIFDVGGVLLRTNNHNYRRALEKKWGLKEWESEQIVFNSDMGKKAQLGEITHAELWRWVGNHVGLENGDLEEFRHDFWAGDDLDMSLVEMIRQLHGRYQTAILSNYNNDLRRELTHDFNIADLFDEIIISAEVNVMKPNHKIYQIALERLGRKPDEAVFIDDFQHNIKGAQEVGLHGIHFTPAINLKDELTALGIEI